MRQEFLAGVTRKMAAEECPWAAIIKKVEGGYRAFESKQDYETWRNQK